MALPGISTLGVLFGYGIETVKGVKPTSFTQLTRINNIAGLSLDTEQIDASALEDLVSAYVAGRQDTGGSWPITVNITDDTIAEWTTLIEASETARKEGLSTWFTVWSPYLEKAFFVVAETPKQIPLPDIGQNEVQTVEMGLSVNRYVGLDDAIKPVAA